MVLSRGEIGRRNAARGLALVAVGVTFGLAYIILERPGPAEDQTDNLSGSAGAAPRQPPLPARAIVDSAPPVLDAQNVDRPLDAPASPADAGGDAVEQLTADTVEIVPIPIPEELVAWFATNDGPMESHKRLEREREEPIWATFMETSLLGFLASEPALADFTILSTVCRSHSCEVLGTGPGTAFTEAGPTPDALTWIEALSTMEDQPWIDFELAGGMTFSDLRTGDVVLFISFHDAAFAAENTGPTEDLAGEIIGSDTATQDDDVILDAPAFAEIPIPNSFLEFFERDAKLAEFHEELQREPDDPGFSIAMEANILDFFDRNPSLSELSLLLVECRSTACEVQAVDYDTSPGLSPAAIEMYGLIQEPWFRGNFSSSGGDIGEAQGVVIMLRFGEEFAGPGG